MEPMSGGDEPVRKARLQVTSVTIGSQRPHDLAHFYARLLTLPVTADDPPVPDDPSRGGWAQIRPPVSGSGPTLNFEYEQHFKPTSWPSVADGHNATQHLDIAVDDLDAAVDWAVAQGATLAEVQPQEGVRVLLDPEGHPFCLFEAPDVFTS
jgi:hypothetical protein